MKKKMLNILMISVLAFAGCSDDNVSSPEINITEVGLDNSGIAYAGSGLHIDADIVAEGRIDHVRLTIHAEGELNMGEILHDDHEEWEVDTTFTTGFNGSKNALFHKDINVSANATEGHYDLYFYVTDMEGNQAQAEVEFEVIHDENYESDHHH